MAQNRTTDRAILWRTTTPIFDEFKKIATEEQRSINQQIEYVVREYIKKYNENKTNEKE